MVLSSDAFLASSVFLVDLSELVENAYKAAVAVTNIATNAMIGLAVIAAFRALCATVAVPFATATAAVATACSPASAIAAFLNPF